MRLILVSSILLLAGCAAAPAWSAVLPLAEAHEPRDPHSPVAETDVDKITYDEQGRPASSDQAAPSLPRRSLEENLRIRNRRGYTVSFEQGEAIPIERSPVARRKAQEGLTALALGETAFGSLSTGDTGPMSRIQPVASSFQPLWVALVPSSVIDPSTGQTVTVLLGVLGPSVGQNGFLSAIGGNTVLADSLVATAPAASMAGSSVRLSTLQRSSSFVALPSQANGGGEPSKSPPFLSAVKGNIVLTDAQVASTIAEASSSVRLSTLQRSGSFVTLPTQAHDGEKPSKSPPYLAAIDGNTVPTKSLITPMPVASVASSSVQLSTLQSFSFFVALANHSNAAGEPFDLPPFLSAMGGNSVLADFMVASTPIASVASRIFQLSTLQRFDSLTALPNQANIGEEQSGSPSLLDVDEDGKTDISVVPNTEIAAVPEASTWMLLLLGFASLIAVSLLRKLVSFIAGEPELIRATAL